MFWRGRKFVFHNCSSEVNDYFHFTFIHSYVHILWGNKSINTTKYVNLWIIRYWICNPYLKSCKNWYYQLYGIKKFPNIAYVFTISSYELHNDFISGYVTLKSRARMINAKWRRHKPKYSTAPPFLSRHTIQQ